MSSRPKRRVRFIAAAAAAAAVASGVITVVSAQAAVAGCRVGYTVANQWPGGFTANITLVNLGDPINGWTLTWSFTAGQQVSQAWNATAAQSGARVSLANASWNAALAGNGSIALGFNGSWTGSNPAPTDFALNGVACTPSTSGTSVPATTAPITSAPTTIRPSTPAPTTTAPPPSTPSSCPASGHVTYTLSRSATPSADETAAYNLIITAMDQAVAMYNCYTNITKALRVSYNPSVATADGNINGSIRFGAKSTMQQITAMHEISHTVGIGTDSRWSSQISGGVWNGGSATGQLRALTNDQAAVLHADSQHFWPYGLNYTSEVKSTADLVGHCKMVVALRQDLGY